MKLQNVIPAAVLSAGNVSRARAAGGSTPIEGHGQTSVRSFAIGDTTFQMSSTHSYERYGDDCFARPLADSLKLADAIKATCGNGTFGEYKLTGANGATQLIGKSGMNCGHDWVWADKPNSAAARCVAAVTNSDGGVQTVGPSGEAENKGGAAKLTRGSALGLMVTLGVVVAAL
jgi:hypothetical protein